MSKTYHGSRAPQNRSAATVEHEGPNFARRRFVVGGAAAVLLVGAALGAKVGIDAWTSNHRAGHEYTADELSKLPKQTVTVEQGEGAQKIVESVEPGIVDDQQAEHDVIDYVQNQGKRKLADGSPDLANTQAVEVPILPGQQGQSDD